ncbi:tRNA (cytidine(34)-2'-O)-methyltransferase [hydrothermal vent metagenome]|uniref:tRNA (Cytidine(34)-2'-O)-methyltransferase n=1 Tax=hydrothermal vent metagenome TaxID=652676 RepID=A0A3B0TWY0_9ZZZZ
MPVELALYQPDIPQNTATLLRLGACLDVPVHIIHPTGFVFSDKNFKRAAMDYINHVQMRQHNSFAQFNAWRLGQNKRLILLSTKSVKSLYDFDFSPDDIVLGGRESAGVPDQVHQTCDHGVRIPMRAQMRSINLGISAAMALGEALRQTGGFAAQNGFAAQ